MVNIVSHDGIIFFVMRSTLLVREEALVEGTLRLCIFYVAPLFLVFWLKHGGLILRLIYVRQKRYFILGALVRLEPLVLIRLRQYRLVQLSIALVMISAIVCLTQLLGLLLLDLLQIREQLLMLLGACGVAQLVAQGLVLLIFVVVVQLFLNGPPKRNLIVKIVFHVVYILGLLVVLTPANLLDHRQAVTVFH